MRKKKPINIFSKLIKKSSIAGIIFLLFTALYQMGDTAYSDQTAELPSSEHPVRLYSNQSSDDLAQLYLEAIKSAKQSVTLVIYSLLDHRVIAALQQKALAGIPVHIICDAKASPGISRKLPNATIVKRIAKGLTHQKILIIDQNKILLGSANMTHDSLRSHGNLVVGLENPGLAKLMVAKARSMDDEGKYEALKHQIVKAGTQTVELWELPDDSGAVERVVQLLRAAKKSIRIAMFTWTRTDFTQELIHASLRGVKVETVIDRYSGKGASAKIVKMLQGGKIPVHFNTTQGLLHYKLAYIDEEILVNGSANWTNAAFKDNDDVFLVIYPLTNEQRTKMNQLWQTIWQQSIQA